MARMPILNTPAWYWCAKFLLLLYKQTGCGWQCSIRQSLYATTHISYGVMGGAGTSSSPPRSTVKHIVLGRCSGTRASR